MITSSKDLLLFLTMLEALKMARHSVSDGDPDAQLAMEKTIDNAIAAAEAAGIGGEVK